MRVCIILPPAPGLFDQKTNIPLGPLYVAAVLEKAGHEVIMISLLGRDVPAAWPEADLYAMGFTTPQAGAARGIMELIRSQHPAAKVLAAGAHPTFLPIQTLRMGFDSVLVGEAERTILQVLGDLPDLEKLYHGVPCEDLDEIPFPARHLLPSEDLFNDAGAVFREDKDAHVTGIMGSRGCPSRCAFCASGSTSLRFRSVENIVAEMREAVELGITCFKLQDDTFTIRSKLVIELGQEVEKAFGHGTISTRMNTRVNSFPERIIPALKQLNLEVASFGIESGSQKILDLSHKGTTIEQAECALRLSHDAGFTTMGFFVFGLPGECEETVDETIAFWERNRPHMDVGVFSVFMPYPGCDVAVRPDFYRMHILNHDWNRYWTTQKKTVVALPYDVSFQKMLDLLKRSIEAFAELGYAKPDWEHDL